MFSPMGLSSWVIHFPQGRGSQYLAWTVYIEMQFTRGSCLFSDLHSPLCLLTLISVQRFCLISRLWSQEEMDTCLAIRSRFKDVGSLLPVSELLSLWNSYFCPLPSLTSRRTWCFQFLRLLRVLLCKLAEKAMAPYSSTLAWKNPMDGGAWWAAVHGVVKSWTQLSDFTLTFCFHALEKETATHSSVLAWRIPGMGEPSGLPSMGSHGVGHDWSNLAAAAV